MDACRPGPPPGIGTLDREDYFRRNPEFSAWLRHSRFGSGLRNLPSPRLHLLKHLLHRGIEFTDLSSVEARNLFAKFVRRWNSGKLSRRYYDLSSNTPAEGSRQRRGRSPPPARSVLAAAPAHAPPPRAVSKSGIRYEASAPQHSEGRSAARKAARRRQREAQRAVEFELVPPKDGFAGRLERRKAASAAFHAGAAEAEDLRDGTSVVPQAQLFGHGDDLAQLKASARRQAKWQEKREARRAERAAQALAKEQAFLEDFKARNGL